jgi:hypothetical protein
MSNYAALLSCEASYLSAPEGREISESEFNGYKTELIGDCCKCVINGTKKEKKLTYCEGEIEELVEDGLKCKKCGYFMSWEDIEEMYWDSGKGDYDPSDSYDLDFED